MKAILVLDEMPKMCEDCPLSQYDSGEGEQFCGADEMARTLFMRRENKPKWCPLKPMEVYEEVMEKIHRLEKELFK